ncbi:MAG: PAS domain S-box protein, partial [Xanthobacteraceae bacterium]
MTNNPCLDYAKEKASPMTGHGSLSHEGVTERKRAKLQLKEEAARLQAVMNTVLDGLIIIDERGVVKMFNPAAVRIFGYQPEEVIGKNVKMLMPEPYHKEHDGYLKHYLTTGEAKVIGIGREVSGRRKDGTTFPMELGVNETQMDGTRMFVGTIRDVTERKQAERSLLIKTKALAESESLHHLLMEGVADYAIIMLSPEGTITSWNSGAEKNKGYTADEALG